MPHLPLPILRYFKYKKGTRKFQRFLKVNAPEDESLPTIHEAKAIHFLCKDRVMFFCMRNNPFFQKLSEAPKGSQTLLKAPRGFHSHAEGPMSFQKCPEHPKNMQMLRWPQCPISSLRLSNTIWKAPKTPKYFQKLPEPHRGSQKHPQIQSTPKPPQKTPRFQKLPEPPKIMIFVCVLACLPRYRRIMSFSKIPAASSETMSCDDTYHIRFIDTKGLQTRSRKSSLEFFLFCVSPPKPVKTPLPAQEFPPNKLYPQFTPPPKNKHPPYPPTQPILTSPTCSPLKGVGGNSPKGLKIFMHPKLRTLLLDQRATLRAKGPP